MTPQEAKQHKHTGDGWDRELVKPFLEVCGLEPSIDIHQIKEKFGTLRIYLTGPEWAQTLVDVFEVASESCCEECGFWNNQWSGASQHYVKVWTNALPNGFWVKTLCQDCRDKRQAEHDADVAKRSLKSSGDVV
jgi:hypothetical protein